VAILLRFVLVLRPRRHVLEDFLREGVADAAAGFALVVAGFVDATVLVVARVGDFLSARTPAAKGRRERERSFMVGGSLGGLELGRKVEVVVSMRELIAEGIVVTSLIPSGIIAAVCRCLMNYGVSVSPNKAISSSCERGSTYTWLFSLCSLSGED
jgi:hypothetical protein